MNEALDEGGEAQSIANSAVDDDCLALMVVNAPSKCRNLEGELELKQILGRVDCVSLAPNHDKLVVPHVYSHMLSPRRDRLAFKRASLPHVRVLTTEQPAKRKERSATGVEVGVSPPITDQKEHVLVSKV